MAASATDAPRALRVGMALVAETLDPARADNMQALMQMAGLYDTLYALDPLAPRAAIVPLAAEALPEISPDHRTFTVRVRRGIFFTTHPAFGGKPRELGAADFAYAIRRVLDPRLHSPGPYLLEGKIEGMDELAARAKAVRMGLDFDAPIPGLTVIDRQTLRIRLNQPDPFFSFLLANVLLSAVPREVVEAEGDR
jgi:peptide/nickel transport system substrate-binding protein